LQVEDRGSNPFGDAIFSIAGMLDKGDIHLNHINLSNTSPKIIKFKIIKKPLERGWVSSHINHQL
ncbi:MAG: hypothetical protein WBJ50_05155, partial [Smithellaceae bacterium]